MTKTLQGGTQTHRRSPYVASAILFVASLGTALLASATHPAIAQGYPSRAVRLIVPFAPGGQVDTVARIASHELSGALGRQFVVDNRPGAGGNLGAGIAAKAESDGHTLIMVSSSFAINPSLSAHTPYDPRRSFVTVHLVATAPNVLLVHPSMPPRTVRELVEFVRARPGKVTYASSGIGTPPHLAGELFASTAKLKLVHVPYKGGGPATIDLIAGEVSMMFLGMAPALPHVSSGRLRPLATTGLKRAGALPDVPTVAESGFPRFDIVNWIGLLAPTGTAARIVERLHATLDKGLASADGSARLAKVGVDRSGLGPTDFRTFLDAEIDKWAAVVKLAGASSR